MPKYIILPDGVQAALQLSLSLHGLTRLRSPAGWASTEKQKKSLRVLTYVNHKYVHINSMHVDTYIEGPNYRVGSDVGEYIRYEHHRSSIAQQVREEDMKSENRLYV